MRIQRTSIFVEDQEKALQFYANVLGFEKKFDVPLGEDRWLSLASPEDPDGTELLLEPNRHPVVKAYQEGLTAEGIPCAAFAVENVVAEFERLTALGVRFQQDPLEMGPVTTAVLDDTCGNLIQILHNN